MALTLKQERDELRAFVDEVAKAVGCAPSEHLGRIMNALWLVIATERHLYKELQLKNEETVLQDMSQKT